MIDLFSILDTIEARYEFLKGLIRVANADGIIDESEIILFNNLSNAMNIDENSHNSLQSLINSNENIPINFTKHEHKMVFFIEAIQLFYIDCKVTELERHEITKIAKELDISLSAINEIEAWVIEGINWSNKVNNLFTLK